MTSRKRGTRAILVAVMTAIMVSSLITPWATAFAQPTAAQPKNLALGGTATASGRESQSQWGPELAIDGNKGGDYNFRNDGNNFRSPSASRWSASSANEGWLAVDLGAEANLDHVTVTWGKQYGVDYTIETSTDGADWKAATPVQHGEASKEKTTKLSGSARHVRVHFTKRNSTWPVGIWELEVFGTWKGNPPMRPGAGLPSVVPAPVTYEAAEGDAFTLSPSSQIVATGDAKAEAEKLAKTLRASTGYALPVVEKSTDDVADITLALSGTGAEESYSVDANARGLALAAKTTHGLFNACQTVYQLFGPWATADFVSNGPWSIPALHIADEPRFEYRGIMLDPARSFFTKDEVKQAIDILSKYKYSYLHLHLTDDQGWRVQITNEGREAGDTIDYTKLAETGGKTAMGTTQQQSKPGVTGFYTQDDLREITAYAHEHHMQIVPEVDMPGHSGGILHCIPQLNTPGSSHDGTVDKDGHKIQNPADYIVAPHQGTSDVGNSYLDPNSDATWTFLKHVVSQVAELTDAQYFHFGGDETHKLNEKHPGEAAKFLTRAATMVRDMNLKPVGWNEWSIADMKAGDTIQFWNGGMNTVTDKIKNSGAKGIYSGAANCYFPQKAGASIWGATWAASGIANIDWFYNYDPAKKMGATDQQMLGVEGAMWNEHVRGIQDFFFPSFPRALATAEVGWTPQAQREGKVADLRRRIVDVAPQMTLAGADFYAEDGLANKPFVAASDLNLSADANGLGAVVAHGYMPMTSKADVSATITWDNGATEALTVNQKREYQAPNPNNNNNRAQNGIWELALAKEPSKDVKSATVELSVAGKKVSDTLVVKREAPAPAKHTVVLKYNDDVTKDATVQVVDGQKLQVDEPAFAGHSFMGWFAEDTDKAWNMSDPVTEDLVLVARWKRAGMGLTDATTSQNSKPNGNGAPSNQSSKPADQPEKKPAKPSKGNLAQTGDTGFAAIAVMSAIGIAAIAFGTGAVGKRHSL